MVKAAIYGIVALMLCSAAASAQTPASITRITVPQGFDPIYVFTDPVTGCQSYLQKVDGYRYLIMGPRLNSDGYTQRCINSETASQLTNAKPKLDPKGRAPDLTGSRK